MRGHQLLVIGLVAVGVVLIAYVIRLERRDDRKAEQRRWADSTRVDPTPTVPPAVLCTAEENAAFERIIAAEYPTIPSQTRRTEEDQ
ncbi:hypothetical protein [Streptomyces sp. NPDC127040]|uniref:hypothetical protein n=1 Tax=Streptomyces sp. NPDC127040 TaxID=3347116 RepID=UPI00364A5C24